MRLAPVFLGSLARRRVATLFSFAAVVLGVALGMGVHAVHEAALSEFGRGLRAMAGEADLQVVGPRVGFDEGLYALLAARPEVAEASPVVEVEAKLTGREETLQLLGVDVFAAARVTPALLARPAAMPEGAAGPDRFAVLAEDRIFLSAAAQTALGVRPADRLRLQVGTKDLTLLVAGDLPGVAEQRRLAVMDIAAGGAGAHTFGVSAEARGCDRRGRLPHASTPPCGSSLCLAPCGSVAKPDTRSTRNTVGRGAPRSPASGRPGSGARSGARGPPSTPACHCTAARRTRCARPRPAWNTKRGRARRLQGRRSSRRQAPPRRGGQRSAGDGFGPAAGPAQRRQKSDRFGKLQQANPGRENIGITAKASGASSGSRRRTQPRGPLRNRSIIAVS